MAEATRIRPNSQVRLTNASSIVSAAIWQLPDGRLGYNRSRSSGAGGVSIFETGDVAIVPKATGITLLDGGRVYWDRTNRVATYKRVDSRSAYLGRCDGGAASADTSVAVTFNIDPPYDLDLLRDPFETAIVGTQSLGGMGLYQRGALHLTLDSTNEAQKVDALSVDGFSIDGNAVIEIAGRILSVPASSAVDISLGFADGTHASDADQIAKSCFIHIDGGSQDILAESDDATHETTATDTTVNYTAGSDIDSRFECWIDTRNPSSVAFYVNAVRVLSSTTFNMSSASGVLKLLVHAEKSASNGTLDLVIDRCCARCAEQ